ncbi:MAG: hypothetical protein LIO46_06310, partial [Clostridiales bacterium]|nr:hypothetical protein [Clostridiales bacterium]
MIRIHEIRLELDDSEAILKEKAARLLNIRPDQITDLRIHKKSVDARKKADIHFVYAVDVALVADEAAVLSRVKRGKAVLLEPDTAPALHNTRQSALRPVVVGFGPAGMFAALPLAAAGARPIVLERGKDADSRRQDVQRFWQENKLNPQSNVQFGEGGAGTFSDGKLTTGIKSPHCRKILETLYECGAPEDILYDAKPHIGTDRLTEVVKNLRRRILKLGGEVRFQCRMTKLLTQQDMVRGIIYQNQDGQEQRLETDAVILALGHSARDTITGLYEAGLFMEQKPFAVGARIEHPPAMIDRAQYGESAGHPALGAADYKLSCHGLNQRGAYPFCMCPGGTVVAAASEPGGVAVNGMSSRARDGMNANAALLVGIPTQT